MPLCGGTSETKPATAEIQNTVDAVRAAAEEKANKPFEKFEAVKYKSQVVAGTNYFVKVKVGSDDFVHLRIFQALPHTGAGPELSAVQLNKALEDELEYF